MLGVSEVALHLDNRFGLLTAGRRTALARHQTLRAALDWSYDLLTASEQCLLRHLSVFPAGFTSEATAAIMRDTGYETTVIDGITNLVGKSLVTLDASTSGGRWRLLETIRAYAFENLQESGEAELALRRHTEFFRDLLIPAGLNTPFEPPPEAIIRSNREIDNVRAALDWCFSAAGDVSIGAAITAAFIPVWLHFAFLAEGRQRAEKALAYLGAGPSVDTSVRMLLHIGHGFALNHTGGRTDEALATLTEGLRIAEARCDTVSQMYALWALWVTHGYRGNYRATEPFAQRYCDCKRRSGKKSHGRSAHGYLVALSGRPAESPRLSGSSGGAASKIARIAGPDLERLWLFQLCAVDVGTRTVSSGICGSGSDPGTSLHRPHPIGESEDGTVLHPDRGRVAHSNLDQRPGYSREPPRASCRRRHRARSFLLEKPVALYGRRVADQAR
jgi:hypothetical protein